VAGVTASYTPGCWVALNVIGCGPCDGRLVLAHLISRQVLRREGFGDLVWHDAVYETVCGGAMGLSGHHGQIDGRTLRIPREVLPGALETFAEAHGLGWWLDRTYGVREVAAWAE
jgi:hypothetical protein